MKQNINEELNYIKYLFGYEKGVVISEQRLLFEQEIKQGGGGDAYQYKKEGGKYFYAKKSEGANAKWIERTDQKGLDAIKTKIFGEQPGGTNTTTATTTQPVTTTVNTTKPPTNTTTVTTTQPVTNTGQQSSVQWQGVPVKGGTFAADKCNTNSNMINNQAVNGFLSDGGSTFYSRSTIDATKKTYYIGYQEPIKANSSSGKKYCQITNVVTYNLKGYTDLKDNQLKNNDYTVYLVTSQELTKPV